jgi:hypothetical protein
VVVAPRGSFAAVRVVQHRNYRPLVVVRVYNRPPAVYGLQYQMQIAGPMPGPGMVFIPGYYTWTDRYVWVNPTWMAPPVVGAVWVAPQWTFDGSQWNLQEGYWREPTVAVAAPAAGWRQADDPAEPVARQPVHCYLSRLGSVTFDELFQVPVPDPQHDCDQLLEYVADRGWVNLWDAPQQ